MILVTGGTSFVGDHLVRKLECAGYKVRLITRNKNYIGNFSDVVQVRTGDIQNDPGAFMQDIETVIHLAAATPNTAKNEEEYFETNVNGTAMLLESALQRGVKRFIYISSSVVQYSELNDNYSESKRQAELLVKSSNLNWTILRPSEILGEKTQWNDFISLLKKKRIMWVFGKGDYYRHPVYYKDIAMAILAVLSNEKTFKNIYNLSCAFPVTYLEYVTDIKEAIKANYVIIKIPEIFFLPFFRLQYLLPKKIQNKLDYLRSVGQNHKNDIANSKKDFSYNPMQFKEMIIEMANETNSTS